MQLRADRAQSHQQLVDQEPIVEHDRLACGHKQLLIRKVGIFDGVHPGGVSLGQNAVQLSARCIKTPRNDERRAAQVNKRDLTTVLDRPSVSQLCGEAGLTAARDPRFRHSGHRCIVIEFPYKDRLSSMRLKRHKTTFYSATSQRPAVG